MDVAQRRGLKAGGGALLGLGFTTFVGAFAIEAGPPLVAALVTATILTVVGGWMFFSGHWRTSYYKLLRLPDPVLIDGVIEHSHPQSVHVDITNHEASDSFTVTVTELNPSITSPGYSARWKGAAGTVTMRINRNGSHRVTLAQWSGFGDGILVTLFAAEGHYGGSTYGQYHAHGRPIPGGYQVKLRFRLLITSEHGYKNEKIVQVLVMVDSEGTILRDRLDIYEPISVRPTG